MSHNNNKHTSNVNVYIYTFYLYKDISQIRCVAKVKVIA